jgi:hypothetical protein
MPVSVCTKIIENSAVLCKEPVNRLMQFNNPSALYLLRLGVWRNKKPPNIACTGRRLRRFRVRAASQRISF